MQGDPDDLLLDAALDIIVSEFGRLVDALRVLTDLAEAIGDDATLKQLLIMTIKTKRLEFDLRTFGSPS